MLIRKSQDMHLFKFDISSINIWADFESSAPVGSSANISLGLVTSALAQAVLCF